MIAVYHQSRNRAAAETLIQRLKADGKAVRPVNADYFESGQLEPVDLVYHDDTVPAIPEAYGAKGVECRVIDTPAEAEDDGAYHLEQSGPWHKLIGPDGEQVGKSKRTAEEAWAILEGGD